MGNYRTQMPRRGAPGGGRRTAAGRKPPGMGSAMTATGAVCLNRAARPPLARPLRVCWPTTTATPPTPWPSSSSSLATRSAGCYDGGAVLPLAEQFAPDVRPRRADARPGRGGGSRCCCAPGPGRSTLADRPHRARRTGRGRELLVSRVRPPLVKPGTRGRCSRTSPTPAKRFQPAAVGRRLRTHMRTPRPAVARPLAPEPGQK